jgi:putative membrane protein
MKFILRILAVAGAMLLASVLVSGISVVSFWPTAVIAAVVLGLLNLIVRPIIKLFSLPITILTLGLFTFVINALLFWLLNLIDGISIDGFISALLGSLIVSVASWLVDYFLDK